MKKKGGEKEKRGREKGEKVGGRRENKTPLYPLVNGISNKSDQLRVLTELIKRDLFHLLNSRVYNYRFGLDR